MQGLLKILVALPFILSAISAEACTAVIISGHATASGRTLMIKVRDSSEQNTDFWIFKGPRYDFVGQTVKATTERQKINGVVSGYNTSGLCMASLTPGKGFAYDEQYKSRLAGGKIVFKALGSCRNMEEFEQLADELLRTRIIIAHLAVVDAEGGAAFYEFGGKSYRKYDVNDPKDAPEGFRVMTNFSFSGDPKLGKGQVRYDNAVEIFSRLERNGDGKFCLTPTQMADVLCRTMVQTEKGIHNCEDLRRRAQDGFYPGANFIVRSSTNLTTTFETALGGEDPSHTVMWVQHGCPFTTPAVPVVLSSGELPQYIVRQQTQDGNYADTAAMFKYSCRLRNGRVYSKPGDSRKSYFNVEEALECMAHARKAEERVERKFLPLQEKWRDGTISDEQFITMYQRQIPKYLIYSGLRDGGKRADR